jgi:hypothetical protein
MVTDEKRLVSRFGMGIEGGMGVTEAEMREDEI